MRHFTNISIGQHVYHTVKAGKFVSTSAFPVDGSYTVVRSIAEALDIFYEDALKFLSKGIVGTLSPGEVKVLNELSDFRKLVDDGMMSPYNVEIDSVDPACRVAVFNYVNLNTGKSVAWFLYLKV